MEYSQQNAILKPLEKIEKKLILSHGIDCHVPPPSTIIITAIAHPQAPEVLCQRYALRAGHCMARLERVYDNSSMSKGRTPKSQVGSFSHLDSSSFKFFLGGSPILRNTFFFCAWDIAMLPPMVPHSQARCRDTPKRRGLTMPTILGFDT